MNQIPVTIEEVISELDIIIDETVSNNNYLGIFAYVYRRTTAQIRQGILDREFEDNTRMEKMDVRFAKKYLEAYQNFNNHEPCIKSWLVPFSVRYEKLTILQHLLMGMNAHINLDLGTSAADIAPGNAIYGLKNDFMKVNDILTSLTEEMQVRIERVSWWMFLVNWIGGKNGKGVINFSMVKAREAAWEFACQLSVLNEEEKKIKIEEVDTIISDLAEIIKRPPGFILRNVLKFISAFEEKEVKRIITGLKSYSKI